MSGETLVAISSLVTVGASYWWLLKETKWLTVRLPSYGHVLMTTEAVVAITPLIIFLALLFIRPLERIKYDLFIRPLERIKYDILSSWWSV